MKIELSNTEYMICTQIGMMRHEINRAASVKDKTIWKSQDKMKIETMGIMAEMAFCKWANLYFDVSCGRQSGTTDVIYQNWKCDIKATERKDGQLMVSQWKKKESSDVYILGIIDGLSVDFVGFATSSDIIQEARLKDLGYGPTYCMTQSELTKFQADAVEVA